MDFTTDGLIASIKRKAAMPTSQSLFTEADFITLCNEELHTTILPLIMRNKEEFFVSYTDFNYGSTNEFDIPDNAIGGKLRDVVFLTGTDEMVNAARLSLEEISAVTNYPSNSTTFNQNSGVNNTGFYIRDNKIVVHPSTAQYTKLRLYYYRRPNYLCSTDDAMLVTSVNGADVSGTVPTTWTTLTEIDVASHKQPFGITESYTISATGSGFLTLSASGVVAGNYICPKGYSVFPQLPIEAHPILVQAVVLKCLEALGDTNGVQLAVAKYAQMVDDFLSLMAPRVDGEAKTIVSAGGIWDYC